MSDLIKKISVSAVVKDPKEKHVKDSIREFLSISVNELKIIKNFYIQGIGENDSEVIAKDVLCCPITETYTLKNDFFPDFPVRLEIAFQPGVMNPESETITEELKDKGYKVGAVMISYTYCFKEGLSGKDIQTIRDRVLMNAQIQTELKKSPESLLVNLKPQK
ncbi:MAG: hypothetical protein WC212_00535, partial [Candidatus Delongbacteria bacterium]